MSADDVNRFADQDLLPRCVSSINRVPSAMIEKLTAARYNKRWYEDWKTKEQHFQQCRHIGCEFSHAQRLFPDKDQ